jgi:hypothetical protein
LARSGAIFFCQILFEGADSVSWRDLEPYIFLTDSLWGSWWRKLAGSGAMIFLSDQKRFILFLP